MNDIAELERNIEERLAAAKDRRLAKQATVRRNMEEQEHRIGQFSATAQRLMEEIVRSRVLTLASLFPNSHVFDTDKSPGFGIVCEFDHTPEYPASTTLSIGISADGAVENAILTYHLEILPIFFRFDGQDQMVVPLSAVDDAAVAAWMDRKLLDFTDTYLQLQTIDQYQQENIVLDPVCGMRINRSNAASWAEYNGQTYYFCVDECRQKFLAGPTRYVPER